jgi:O-antigen/teichoic acid export membrane protein
MAVFKALECMHYIALQQSLNSAAVVVWVGASLALNAGLAVTVAGLAVGQLVEIFAGWIILRRMQRPLRFHWWDRVAAVRIMAASFPIGFTAILVALNVRVDIFVVSRYTGAETLGQFNAAMWFLIAAFLIASLLMSVLFPKLSRILEARSQGTSHYLLTLVKNALCMTALSALAVWAAAPAVIPLLFGSGFGPAASTLRVLAPALPLIVLNTIFFYIFAAARRRFVCLGTLVFALGAGVLLSINLTSAYGVQGAAIAAVVREFAMSSIYLFFLIEGDYARDAGFAILKVLTGATAVLLLSLIFAPLSAAPLWLAAWMALVLGGTMSLLGIPKAREWRLLTDDQL